MRPWLFAGALLVSCLALSFFSPVAPAVPAFARKTGLACSACHEVWPRLNPFGQLFRDRGYRLENDRDAPVEQSPYYWPIAARTTVGYQWLRQSLVPTDLGPTTTNQGTFGFDGLDLFVVGTLGDRVSFLITYSPGLAGSGFQLAPNAGESDLEAAWAGFNNILGTSYLNVRVGKHALDLPIDEHRTITLTQDYNVYHFHPAGSTVAWAPGDSQAGLELYGHSELSRLRYSISFVNEGDSNFFSNALISNPVVWAHFTGQQIFGGGVLASAKAGVFGSVGFHPAYLATYLGAGVPSSAYGMKAHWRYGAEAHVQLLSVANPLTFSGVIWGGSDARELIQNATQDGRFLGGFVEGVFTISPRISLVGRAERIVNTQRGDATAPQSEGNTTAFTAAIRHTFELTSRTEGAFQLELSSSSIEAADGTAPNTLTGLLAVDFAL
jgi:hypothetical protein